MKLRSHILHVLVICFAIGAIVFFDLGFVFAILAVIAALALYADAMLAQHMARAKVDVNATIASLEESAEEVVAPTDETSELVTEAIRQLAENLSQGDLTARIQNAAGIDESAVSALNDALATLNSAVDEALALADVASDGDLSARASGSYPGHMGTLAKTLNGLLDGLHQLVSTLVDAVEQNEMRSRKMAHVASDLSTRSGEQRTAIEDIENDVQGICSGLDDISRRANASRDAMDVTIEATALGRERISQAVSAIERVEAGSKEIGKVVELIAGISQQSQLLSINALVEAARAGSAGKGFSYVAKEVGVLATRTSEAAQNIAEIAKTASEDIEAGSRLVNATVKTIDQIDENASRAHGASNEILSAANVELDRANKSRSRLVETRNGADANSRLAEKANAVSKELSQSAEELRRVTDRFNLDDNEMASNVMRCAAEASKALEDAVSRGEISMDDLFMRDYDEIEGSNPAQYMTPYVPITDKYISPIIESVFDMGSGFAFGAVVNDEGFLSTHSQKFSKPQGKDPVWNAANSRNRRFFTDRVGLACAKSKSEFLLQVYRRDMGGGSYTTMKDISAPIYVKGRHWGGFRIGYRTVVDQAEQQEKQILPSKRASIPTFESPVSSNVPMAAIAQSGGIENRPTAS